MQYLITFLEGIISFISPCVLPMLPVYISYFAGRAEKKENPLYKSLAFVLGFTIVFCLLGVFAGSLGFLISKYHTIVNIVCGLIIILLALSFIDIIYIPFFKGTSSGRQIKGIFSAFTFGMVFSINLSPCVGTFLGAALMSASSSGTAARGALLLLTYSLGLGVPFVLSSVLIDKLTGLFGAIKKHYHTINIVCAVFLIIIGILMMTGNMSMFINSLV